MYRQKKKKNHVYVTYMREASEASERLRNICCFQVSKYICMYTYIHNQCSAASGYGIINDSMTDKTLTLRKSIHKIKIKILHLLILKRLFPSMFCFVGTSDNLSQKHIYFQVSNYISIHTYTINAVSYHYLWYMAL